MMRVDVTFSTGLEKFGEVADASGSTPIKKRLVDIPEISRRINKDGGFENSVGVITLNNFDGYFDDKFKKDEKIEVYDSDEINGWILVFTGKFAGFVRAKPSYLKFRADTRRLGFQDPISETIKIDDFANCPDENLGKWKNIIAGCVNDIGGAAIGMVTAVRVDTNKYLLAGHHCHALIKCFDSDVNDITGSCALDNNADGNAYINYTSADDEIYVNCYGMETGSTYVRNPAEILDEINTAFGSFTLDGITDATAVYEGRSYTGEYVVIDDSMTWEQFLKVFARNYDCRLFQKANGNLGIKVLDWGTETAESTIEPIYVDDVNFEKWLDADVIIDEYQRRWWWHYRDRNFQLKASDVTADTDYSADREKLDLEFHSDDETAKDVAARLIFFNKKPRIWWSFSLPKTIANPMELASVYALKSKRWSGTRLIQIYVKTHVGGGNRVRFEALDITDINSGLIILRNESDSDVALLYDESSASCGVLL
jgi:hypothetical protein